MTNTAVLAGLTVIRLITNQGATTVWADGVREQRYVVTAEVPVGAYSKTFQFSKPPLPASRSTPPPPSAVVSELPPGAFAISAASIAQDDCCPMLAVSFLAQTNRIYGLERSLDLKVWELRLPEVDGEGAPETFWDVFDGAATYRVASRPGVLPTGTP